MNRRENKWTQNLEQPIIYENEYTIANQSNDTSGINSQTNMYEKKESKHKSAIMSARTRNKDADQKIHGSMR